MIFLNDMHRVSNILPRYSNGKHSVLVELSSRLTKELFVEITITASGVKHGIPNSSSITSLKSSSYSNQGHFSLLRALEPPVNLFDVPLASTYNVSHKLLRPSQFLKVIRNSGMVNFTEINQTPPPYLLSVAGCWKRSNAKAYNNKLS